MKKGLGVYHIPIFLHIRESWHRGSGNNGANASYPWCCGEVCGQICVQIVLGNRVGVGDGSMRTFGYLRWPSD